MTKSLNRLRVLAGLNKTDSNTNKLNESVERTNTQIIREWANSIDTNYEDRGHCMDTPKGETVDLSLRRYLKAKGMPVHAKNSLTENRMARKYRNFKRKHRPF